MRNRDWEEEIGILQDTITEIWVLLYVDHPEDAMQLAEKIIPSDIRFAALEEFYTEYNQK